MVTKIIIFNIMITNIMLFNKMNYYNIILNSLKQSKRRFPS